MDDGCRPPWSHRNVVDLKSYACGRLGVVTDLKNCEIARLSDVEEPALTSTAPLRTPCGRLRMFRAVLYPYTPAPFRRISE